MAVRRLQQASLVLLTDLDSMWRFLRHVRHAPPIRVIDVRQAGPVPPEGAVIDLRDDGSLVGGWGFSISAGQLSGAASVIATYHELASQPVESD